MISKRTREVIENWIRLLKIDGMNTKSLVRAQMQIYLDADTDIKRLKKENRNKK